MKNSENIKSPKRVSDAGNPSGGCSFSRGALYSILKNPAYIGKIKHKKQVYDGLHEPIIDEEKWQQVQRMLTDNTVTLQKKTQQRHVLQGLLFDIDGVPFSPTFTKKRGRQYRYYISQNLLQFKHHPKGLIARLPAHEVEQAVLRSAKSYLSTTLKRDDIQCEDLTYIADNLHEITLADIAENILEKVIPNANLLTLHFKEDALNYLAKKMDITLQIDHPPVEPITLSYHIKRIRDGAVVIETADRKYSLMDKTPTELKSLVQGLIWRDRHLAGETIVAIAKEEKNSKSYVHKLIMSSFDSLMQAA